VGRIFVVATSEIKSSGSSGTAGTSSALVDLGQDGLNDLLELLEFGVELVLLSGLVGLDPIEGLLDSRLEGLAVIGRQFGADLLLVVEGVSDGVGVVLEGVLGLDLLLHLAIILGGVLSLFDHSLDLLLREAILVVGDGDGLALAGALVFGGDVQDAVDVDLERDLDLGNSSSGRGDAREFEFAKEMVIFGHGAFSFEDLDEDAVLVVLIGREDLGFLGGDESVSRDEGRHDSTDGFDTKGEGDNVEEDDLIGSSFAGEDASLDGGTIGDGFVGVNASAGFLAIEEFLEELLDLGDTSGASDQDDLMDFVLLQSSVVEDLLDGSKGLLEEIHVDFLKTGAGQGLGEVLSVEEGFDFDLGLGDGGEGAFGAFDLSLQFADGPLVLGRVGSGLLLPEVQEMLDHAVVEVFSSEMRVSVGGDDFENAVVDGQEGDVEGSSSEIVNEDVLLARGVIEPVCDGGGGRFVDDSSDIQARDETGVFCGER